MFQSKSRLMIRIVAGLYVLYVAGRLIVGIYNGSVAGRDMVISVIAIILFGLAGTFFVVTSALAWKQAKAEEAAALEELRKEKEAEHALEMQSEESEALVEPVEEERTEEDEG